MDDFIKPKSVRLPISGGHYIDVKRRLSHGEREDMYANWSPLYVPGAPTQLQRREVRTSKVAAYLLGWSLTDEGVPVPMSLELPEKTRVDTIRNLDPDRFDEIHKAIEAHEDAMQAEREAQKNGRDGATVSPAISPSLSDAGGGSNGSGLSTQTSTQFS